MDLIADRTDPNDKRVISNCGVPPLLYCSREDSTVIKSVVFFSPCQLPYQDEAATGTRVRYTMFGAGPAHPVAHYVIYFLRLTRVTL